MTHINPMPPMTNAIVGGQNRKVKVKLADGKECPENSLIELIQA